MSSATEIPIPQDRAFRLATLLQSIAEMKKGFAITRAEFRASIGQLESEAFALRIEILYGQKNLFEVPHV